MDQLIHGIVFTHVLFWYELWYVWMYSCSNGINNVVLLMCFSKVMVSLIGLYSCLLLKMCSAYDD